LTAVPIGFAVVGLGGVGFGQYRLWFFEGFGLWTSGFERSFCWAIGLLDLVLAAGCLMVCRLFCGFAFGGAWVLLEKSGAAVKKTVDGLVGGV
jgi:hypothetical protein